MSDAENLKFSILLLYVLVGIRIHLVQANTRKTNITLYKFNIVTSREIMPRHIFDLTSPLDELTICIKNTRSKTSHRTESCDIGISHYSYKQDSHTSRWENIAFKLPPHPLMAARTYVYTLSNKKRTCVTEELRDK